MASSSSSKEEDTALESFLFLPQLPVLGDDGHKSASSQSIKSNQNGQLLFSRFFGSPPFKPSSITDHHTNHNHNSHHPPKSLQSHSIIVDHCGNRSAIDTVITTTTTTAPAHSEPGLGSASGVKSHLFSSSMKILMRNAESCNNSEEVNHSPFSLAANSSHHHHYPRRFLIFRICQAVFVILCLLFLLNLVKTCVVSSSWISRRNSKDEYKDSPSLAFSSHNRLIQSWNMPSIHSSSSASSSSESKAEDSDDNDDTNAHNLLLFDIPNFTFLLDNKTKCRISSRDSRNNYGGDENTIFFMIIVHSAPQNTMERQTIRETWGGLQRLGLFHVRLVFLLGHDISNQDSNDFLKIRRESEKFGDIVAGNFHDSYRNLTYKHLMGYKWILSHCSDSVVKFVLKCDDDVFMDIFQLYDFLIRTFGPDPDPSLICNVFPKGTKPVRRTDTLGKKWAVTYDEYPYDSYPKYCGGLAYLATPNVIREIYGVSRTTDEKYLWIDDVYVTGILRELAHVEPFYLNLRYSYDPEEYRKWLQIPLNNNSTVEDMERRSEKNYDHHNHNHDYQMTNEKVKRMPPPIEKIPFMIVHLERGPFLSKEMQMLWNKTRIVWSGLIF